jgi:organic radical activating enzyme
MFGTNPIRKFEKGDGSGRVSVIEIFPTIQGEGPLSGLPAHFVRLAGCNLACTYCDTDFETDPITLPPEEILRLVDEHDIKSDLVVITGGEPLRQELAPLLDLFVNHGYRIQIETAGTVCSVATAGMIRRHAPKITLVCSPKTNQINGFVAALCHDYKYIIREGETDPVDGLPNMSSQLAGVPSKIYRPTKKEETTIWLQPCEEYGPGNQPDIVRTTRNHTQAALIAMEHGYRVSLQIHKILGLN